MVKIKIPTPLRRFTNEQSEIEIESSSIKELIEVIGQKYPDLKKRLCDEEGNIRKFINVYVGEEDIRFLKGLDTEIKNEDEVNIVPAISGG